MIERSLKWMILFLAIGIVTSMAAPTIGYARVGGGRSFGRPSGMGPRGAQSAPRYAAPRHEPNAPAQPAPPPPAAAPRFGGGGFLRGVAGGFLGSMLFSSLGHAVGFEGNQGGGGVGLFEILLFAGLGYFGFRWWKSRQAAAPIGAQTVSMPQWGVDGVSAGNRGPDAAEQMRALMPVEIDPEVASDIFFKVQGAWTRRDLTSVQSLLGPDVQVILESDLTVHRANHTINRLENIAVRRTEIIESWQEDGHNLCTVRFVANLLDYTVNESTGQVLEGNSADPVKFEEDWTFEKRAGASGWVLVGISQVPG